jgi:DNA-binding MarR family transcriptional regulator
MKQHHRGSPLDSSVLHLIHRTSQCAEVIFAAELGSDKLTPRQYAVLLTVAGDEDTSQTGLVEATGIDRSTLADVVGRLVTRRLLSRRRTRKDARTYAVRVTSKGLDMLKIGKPVATRTDERILSALRPNQRAEFKAALQVVVAAMKRLAKPN